MSTNSLIGGKHGGLQVNPGPRSSTGDISFSHTEFIQNVVVTASGAGNTSFQLQSFNLNPGIAGTFPFLAQMACNYTMWEARGLIFEYRPLSGEHGSSVSNSLGKVVFCTNYDSTASEFVTAQEMENYVGAVSTKPAFAMRHGVETAPRERLTNLMYIRQGPQSTGVTPAGQKDRNTTDLGLFQMATEGIYASAAGQQVIGELWVSYRIVLTRPKLCYSILGNGILQDVIEGVATGNTFGVAVNKSTNTLGCTFTLSASQSGYITWPSNVAGGTYRVVMYATLSDVDAYLGPAATGTINSLTSAATVIKWGLTGVTAAFSQAVVRGTDFSASLAPAAAGSAIAGTALLLMDVVINAPGTTEAVLEITTRGAGATLENYAWGLYITQVANAPTLIVT